MANAPPPFFLQTGIWKCFTSLHFVVSIKIPFQQFYFQKWILQKCLHKGTKVEVKGCSQQPWATGNKPNDLKKVLLNELWYMGT